MVWATKLATKLRCQGLGSDARANVSVYIFALACFHLVFLVLVGGWGVSFLVIRSDKIRSDLVRSGQIRSGQTRSDQGRSGQGWSLCYVWDDHGVEILILSRWGNIENPYSYVVEETYVEYNTSIWTSTLSV